MKYKFFWSGPYSNWYKVDIVIDNKTFTSSEQYYMYMKAFIFNDFDTAKLILATNNCKEQKKLGRNVKGFDQQRWDILKYDVMWTGVYNKFLQNPGLLTMLRSEQCEKFVEASPFDRIWGIGYDENTAMTVSENEWGENLLGKILTNVRDQLTL